LVMLMTDAILVPEIQISLQPSRGLHTQTEFSCMLHAACQIGEVAQVLARTLKIDQRRGGGAVMFLGALCIRSCRGA